MSLLLHSLVRAPMGDKQHSREVPPSNDGGLSPIASPVRPQYRRDDDEADAYTIYSMNTQRFARQRSIGPTRRGDDETL
jgi:hypothetical protein